MISGGLSTAAGNSTAVILLTAQPRSRYTLYVTDNAIQAHDTGSTFRSPQFLVDLSTPQKCIYAYFILIGQFPLCAACMQYLYMVLSCQSRHEI